MANSKFVVDTGLVVGPLTIFASNGDIRTSGNIVYTGSGPDNPISAPSPSQGFTNSTTLYFPLADYAVTQTTSNGVVTTTDESSLGLTTLITVKDAFNVAVSESGIGATDLYDCMEPAGSVETVDLGELS